jgi:hypothetical protein
MTDMSSGPVNVPYPPSLAGFHLGLLAGFLIGWVHGNFALFRFRNPKKMNEVAVQRTNVEDQNPYRPPSIVTIFDRDQGE